MKKNLIILASVLILGMVVGVWLCSKLHPSHRQVSHQRDTIIRDTLTIEKPVPVKVTEKETLLVAVHDTTFINDTIFVPIPIDKKIYKAEDYLVEISGYKANLDKIEVYPKTTYLKSVETVTNRNLLKFGIEPSYCNTLSIPIYLEYERMLHRNIGINAKFFYDLNTRLYGVGAGVNIQIGW